MNKRRIVIHSISAAGILSATGLPLWSRAALQKVDPKDAQAASLGYVEDTTKVDEKKFPKHTKEQTCANCQFYQTAQEEGGYAPCTVFGGKGVAAKGWCSAWVKKAS